MEDWVYPHLWGQFQFKGHLTFADYFEDFERAKSFDV